MTPVLEMIEKMDVLLEQTNGNDQYLIDLYEHIKKTWPHIKVLLDSVDTSKRRT